MGSTQALHIHRLDHHRAELHRDVAGLPGKFRALQLHLFPAGLHRVLHRADHFRDTLRRHGLRDEPRLPRAHPADGGGAVDRPVGLGDRAVVLGDNLRS